MIDIDKLEGLEEPDYDRILEKQDFFPKIFLIPSEIKLDQKEGIKVIKRTIQQPDKVDKEEQVLPISVDEQQIRAFKKPGLAENRRHPAGHGLISLFKKTPKRRIKLAICICVYSQSKHMLKSTIKGIQQSYKDFERKAGILPHEIILTVIFDGIEKVNASKDQTQNMISFFNEIDIKNGFVYKPYGKSLQQYLKQLEQRNYNISRLQAEKMGEDISLFTQQELNELKTKLFENQYNQYMRVNSLLRQIQKLKKQRTGNAQILPIEIYKKYENLCYHFCMENGLYYETQQQIQEYLSTKKNIRVKLIYEAITQTENLCKKYIQSRQDKSILYPVRLQSNDFKNPRTKEERDEQSLQEMKADPHKNKEYNYMFFVVKHKNQGKLSSHMLFFKGFCKLFDPEYCMLTDVGIKPHKDAIYRMWAHMEQNPKCGGVCGYMGLQLENPEDDLGYREDGFQQQHLDCLTRCTETFFKVQRAQQFQYHFAHMLDKPFEAAFGYIHVLPGAFSGYRWKALKSIPYNGKQQIEKDELPDQIFTERDINLYSHFEDENEQTLMARYLKIASIDQSEISLQDSNMYLAEDRIMCLGIHALGYDLHYLPDAESTVDPVTSLTRLLGQRRRWINGSWFAFNYVKSHSHERSNFIFLIQLYYYIFVQMLAWTGPGFFYVAMNLTLVSAVRQYVAPLFLQFFNVKNDYDLYNYNIWVFNVKNIVESIPDVINFIYIMVIFSVVIFSLLVNNNNNRFKPIYYLASSLLGLYGLAVLFLLVYNSYQIISDTIKGNDKNDFIIPIIYLRILIIFILVGHGIPVIWTFSFKKYVQMLTALFSYLFYVPTYVNILQIFAFSRIDDLSWGTKGLDADNNNSVAKQWERRKYVFVLQYLSWNVAFSYLCVKLSEMTTPRNWLILITTCLVAFMLLFRIIPAGIYLLLYNLRKICGRKFSAEYVNKNLSNGKRVLNALKVIELKIKQIEKAEVKKKKEAEFQKVASAATEIFSKSLSGANKKMRSRFTQHLVNNNLIPKKEIMDQNKKMRRKIMMRKNPKKKLKTVEEVNQQSEQSKINLQHKKQQKVQRRSEINYGLVAASDIQSQKKNSIKQRMRQRRLKKERAKQEKSEKSSQRQEEKSQRSQRSRSLRSRQKKKL